MSSRWLKELDEPIVSGRSEAGALAIGIIVVMVMVALCVWMSVDLIIRSV